MNSWARPAIPGALIVLFVFLAYKPGVVRKTDLG